MNQEKDKGKYMIKDKMKQKEEKNEHKFCSKGHLSGHRHTSVKKFLIN